ncbi:hypothetical protein SBV1_1420045 [Verrucomicrobia bacterium]|nr:hypothetical protein SBV1_1420045 [Verrucomicrobiota bacterium]
MLVGDEQEPALHVRLWKGSRLAAHDRREAVALWDGSEVQELARSPRLWLGARSACQWAGEPAAQED